MDKDTRNAIERATQRARKLLEEDFAAQLASDFDVHLNGAVAERAGSHLSARQAFQRERIVAAIEHKRAAGTNAFGAVADYLRDAAFTTFNRFVALKMLEARELVQECITKGEQSSGYREFYGMAPGLPLLPDSAGYRLYIESIFDELSTEVKVLFDRRDPSSALWPKRVTFEQLLEILNTDELARVWVEDETIGWVYQFFNGQDERRKMREESQAPRNSRELAVRNQFFTPRYVVQFLTDNTLGRIWYEMRSTNTVLANRCEYMVRKPGEEFASRAKKDPRDLSVLDPACGSGHFLLYAFDLLLTIYEEAHGDADSPMSEATGRRLAEDFPTIDALREAIPGLVLAHNLHGVDIDPRCAQIAQLALWMRAQKAYREFGIDRTERPEIRRSNIVVAEPLVVDDRIAAEFVARLRDVELGCVFMRLVEALNVAGELGLLLRVETLVARVAEQGRSGNLFAPTEERIRATLSQFVAEEGGRTSTRRWLFADDAKQGVGLLGIAEKRFDAVLMNPPFGLPSEQSANRVAKDYPDSLQEIAGCFVRRALELLRPNGLLGVLSSRNLYFLQKLAQWRKDALWITGSLRYFLDLGYGVLDAAMVETAAAVVEASSAAKAPEAEAVFISRLDIRDKGLRPFSRTPDTIFNVRLSLFAARDFEVLPYWVPERILASLALLRTFRESGGAALKGMSTDDDPRFLRLWWECSPDAERWLSYAKGGEWSPFFADMYLRVNWGTDGRENKAAIERFHVSASRRIVNEEYFRKGGITYSDRTTSGFGPRLLSQEAIFSTAGPAIAPLPSIGAFATLGFLASRFVHSCVEMNVGAGDSVHSGSAARHYTVGVINTLPVPAIDELRARLLGTLSEEIAAIKAIEASREMVSLLFGGMTFYDTRSLRELSIRLAHEKLHNVLEVTEKFAELDTHVSELFGLGPEDLEYLDEQMGPLVARYSPKPIDAEVREEALTLYAKSESQLVARGLEVVGGKRYITKCVQVGDRRLELICHILAICSRQLVEVLLAHATLPIDLAKQARDLVEYGIGLAFGRWKPKPEMHDNSVDIVRSMLRLPRVPPALNAAAACPSILVSDAGHPDHIASRITDSLATAWPTHIGRISEDLVASLGAEVQDFEAYLQTSAFDFHLATSSEARRKAPIYWQLATPSAGYSVWLYIHAFSKDTLFRVQNEYAAQKLAHEERSLEALTSELRDGATPAQRKALAVQENFVEELRAFLEEVKRVTPMWSPNLDDGVIINFAPLWRLVPQHKAWQKELKLTWDALCEGTYDWAHLAMHLWPERLIPKCAKDRSLAIAHGLEDVFWIEGAAGKWTARKTPTRSIEELVRERTSPAVKAALKSLLEAPTLGGNGGRSRGGRRRPIAASTVDGGDH